MKHSRLILFTDSYPYGSSEPFLESEITYLANAFDHIDVIPRRYGGDRMARAVPDGVNVSAPLVPDNRAWALCRGIFNLSPVTGIMREACRARVFGSGKRFVKWLEAVSLIRHGLRHPLVRALRKPAEERAICYFYWGLGASWLAPYLHASNVRVARFHGYDVYEDRPGYRGYMPFREAMLNHLDHAVYVSEHGRDYVSSRYPGVRGVPHVCRLGVESGPRAAASQDGMLRMVSCSAAVPVKRLGLIVEALQHVTHPVQWTHIGGGKALAELKRSARQLPQHIKTVFTGPLPHHQVAKYYDEHPVDLFLNVSESEGVPVAVMEALASAVPVFATAVGGTPELVDDKVGLLLDVDVSPENLADEIMKVAGNGPQLARWRDEAYKRWTELADADRNYREFAGLLLEWSGSTK